VYISWICFVSQSHHSRITINEKPILQSINFNASHSNPQVLLILTAIVASNMQLNINLLVKLGLCLQALGPVSAADTPGNQL
jgi:uncharacterized membrane protein YhhN